MKTVMLAIVTLLLSVPCKTWAQLPPNGSPVIRLDKSRFASGEAVLFWVGVKATNHGSIPKAYWNTCRLTIMRPDGVAETQPVAWPMDGMVERGWEGGAGLFQPPQPGIYKLDFEFAGQKTAPTSLIVEDLPILKKIKAEFVFGMPPTSQANADKPVTFTVINNSDQTIRFSHRDGLNGLVWVSLAKTDRSYRNDFFYPANGLLDQDEPKLPNQGYEKFTWEMAQKMPTITLAPGKTYRQQLSLNAALKEASQNSPLGSGRYQITFGTNLQVLIGESNGALAAFSPVYVPVTATIDYTLAP